MYPTGSIGSVFCLFYMCSTLCNRFVDMLGSSETWLWLYSLVFIFIVARISFWTMSWSGWSGGACPRASGQWLFWTGCRVHPDAGRTCSPDPRWWDVCASRSVPVSRAHTAPHWHTRRVDGDGHTWCPRTRCRQRTSDPSPPDTDTAADHPSRPGIWIVFIYIC